MLRGRRRCGFQRLSCIALFIAAETIANVAGLVSFRNELRYPYVFRRRRIFKRMAKVPPDQEPKSSVRQGGRRRKKNKYASFSKADSRILDPFEEMVAESERKIELLELEQLKKSNKAVPLDNKKRNEKRVRNQIQFPDAKSIDPYDPTTYGYVELGTITGAHGVKGLVKIAAVTDFAERLCEPGLRHLKPKNRRSPRQIELIEGRHAMGDEYLVKLHGIGDRDTANKLRGSVLYSRQEERPTSIGEEEFLISDLVGLEVFLENESDEGVEDTESFSGRFVGTVSGIVLADDICEIRGLGQDLLEIVLPRGRGGMASWRDELVLVPFVPQIVPRIEMEDGAIFISPPNGLLDLTYVREEKVRIKGFLPPAKD